MASIADRMAALLPEAKGDGITWTHHQYDVATGSYPKSVGTTEHGTYHVRNPTYLEKQKDKEKGRVSIHSANYQSKEGRWTHLGNGPHDQTMSRIAAHHAEKSSK